MKQYFVTIILAKEIKNYIFLYVSSTIQVRTIYLQLLEKRFFSMKIPPKTATSILEKKINLFITSHNKLLKAQENVQNQIAFLETKA